MDMSNFKPTKATDQFILAWRAFKGNLILLSVAFKLSNEKLIRKAEYLRPKLKKLNVVLCPPDFGEPNLTLPGKLVADLLRRFTADPITREREKGK